ncbi:sensor histidine kinase [Kineosporia succinea]|uniref:histidine kinase n=1 Tax=Kineosporia succinea TaxID=84632 RepID=A0ABT9PC26_9ACTN|nr:histidine kinase [Kineosporia succinea]MDP9830257.1 signal transduction histidine kinase [Kineosporia succinea]
MKGFFRPVTPLRGRPVRSWALDGALAAVVALAGLERPDGPTALAAALFFVLMLLRRIWVLPVNLAMLVLTVVVWSAHANNVLLHIAVVTIAVHTVTVLCSLRAACVALALSLVLPLIFAAGAMSSLNSVMQKILIFVGLAAPQTLAFALGLYRQTRDRHQEALNERNRHLEVEREQRDQLAAADERARIAREMHDLIAHHLTVVVALSEGLARSGEITSERSRQAVTTTVTMARSALEETRRLLGTMPASPERQPVPDLRSLDGLVSQVRATGLPVTLEVEGDPPGELASSGLQLTVYRLVQEALTNSMKHAQGATRTVVRLGYRPEAIEILIEDDGRGGSGVESADGRGRGILGMRQRVQSFGGTLEAGPASRGGWRVSAGFPLTGAANDEVAR